MDTFILLGSVLGAIVGLLHGAYLYRRMAAQAGSVGARGERATAVYYGLWTFVLWTLFGSYVLAIWLLGAVGYATAKLNLARRSV